jgi:glycosyltransferase involved in cell wall biosynthesis
MELTKMRIALLSWESLHSIVVGGVAVHVTELGAALERKGHEVHIFTRVGPGQPLYDWIDGVHYHRCPYPFHPDFVDDVNNMCRAFVDHVFAVEDHLGPFDIIHAHDWLAANAMIWIKHGRERRGILTIHATEYARCGNTFPGGQSHRVRDQERAGTYWADHVIAVSQATKDELLWMYEVPDWKVTVAPNGVSANRFDREVDVAEVRARYQIGPLDPTILFCGRLVWQKGPDLLMEAVPSILRHYDRAKFIFAGDGGMRGQLEDRARQLGVAHATRFLGHMNGDGLVDIFKSCDVVCVPSRNEPFGIVVLEAWSAEKAVVVTQCGGPNEFVDHEVNGLKIHPNVDSVAWGLGTALADFDRARSLGRNGRHTVTSRFTWDAVAAATLKVYDPSLAEAEPAPEKADYITELKATTPAEPVEILDHELVPEADQPRHIGIAAELILDEDDLDVPAQEALAACQEAAAPHGVRLLVDGDRIGLTGDLTTVFAALQRCQEVICDLGGSHSSIRIASRPPDSLLHHLGDASEHLVLTGVESGSEPPSPGSPRRKAVRKIDRVA